MGADLSASRVYSDTELTPVSSVGHLPVILSPEMIVPRVTSIHLGMDTSVRDTPGIPRIRLFREIPPWSHFVPKMALLVSPRVISFPRRPFLAVSNTDVTRFGSRTQLSTGPFRLRATVGEDFTRPAS